MFKYGTRPAASEAEYMSDSLSAPPEIAVTRQCISNPAIRPGPVGRLRPLQAAEDLASWQFYQRRMARARWVTDRKIILKYYFVQ